MNQLANASLETTIRDIWSNDTLGRSLEAETIKSFLLRRTDERKKVHLTGSFVLNIDAPWGSGKTFFLNRFQQQLEAEKYLVCYINAWEDDHAEDPLLSVLSGINSAIAPLVPSSEKIKKRFGTFKKSSAKIAVSLVKNVSKTLLKRYAGDFLDEVQEVVSNPNIASVTDSPKQPFGGTTKDAIENVIDEVLDETAKNLISNFERHKDTIVKFKINLAKLLQTTGEFQKRHNKMFVFVDELDRCRPTYAIAMLERIKHLFDTDGIMFIVATDTQQLQHSIKAVYGQEFDASRYLLRFFGRQYHLKAASKRVLIERLFNGGINKNLLSFPGGAESVENYFEKVDAGFGLTPRDTEQCFEFLNDIVSTWPFKAEAEIALLLPLIILHHQARYAEFEHVSNCLSSGVDMQKLANQLNFGFTQRDRYSGQSSSVTGFQWMCALAGGVKHDFSERGNPTQISGAAFNWAYDRVSVEISIEHNGAIYSNNAPVFSIMRRYGEIVRSISCFS